jgi:hypothetical protein
MKQLFIIIAIAFLCGCKSKDGCSTKYTDCANNAVPQDLAVFCAVDSPTNSEQVEIINASCKTLHTNDYTLGDDNDQDAYKLPNIKLKPGEHKIYSNADLPFQINDNGETIYLKHKGKIISTLHLQ